MNCKIYYDGSQFFNVDEIKLVEEYAVNFNTTNHDILVTKTELGLSIVVFKYYTIASKVFI